MQVERGLPKSSILCRQAIKSQVKAVLLIKTVLIAAAAVAVVVVEHHQKKTKALLA